MSSRAPTDLDDFIEAALGGEPLRPVPVTLHGRVTARLHIAALMTRERRRYRHAKAVCLASLAAMGLCAGLFVVLADLPHLAEHAFPGGRGYVDYLAASLRLAWSCAPIPVPLLAALLAASAVALWPLRRILT